MRYDEDHKQKTRQKVLDAARALFIERGYEAATVRDIAGHAGMSTGAVFANFQDKSDLFEAVMVEDFERVAEHMRSAALPAAPVADRLLNVLSAAYAYYFDSLPLVLRVPDVPALPLDTPVRVAVGNIDLLTATLECRYAGTLGEAPAA